ncbi:EamA family transporter [Streptomyces sp. CC219B]|uniref:EamA family transporter n=1 Tax=Streptomyces sp. CC219B TaxID=3044574 RepID=UPI0024A8E251|nr:EamA family transporter [Streptomyces sp. CC219B]
MNTVLSVLALGTASALAYAAAAVGQRTAALRAGGPHGTGLRRSGAWWISILCNALGAVLHTAALRYGSLVAVQMLGVLTLVAAPLLSSAVLRHRMTPAQWSGTALTVAGVVGLLALVPSAGTSRTLDPRELAGVVGLTAVAMGVPAVAAAVTRRPGLGGLSYAAAAGVAFAAASALAQTAVLQVTGDGSGTLATTVLVAGGVIGLAPAGLLLCQLAYRDGLEAPLATVTLVNPVFAVLIGVAVLGDRYATDPLTVLAALTAALAAARGVYVLARAEAHAAPAGARPQVAAPGGHFWGIRSRRPTVVRRSGEASGSMTGR